MIPFNFIKATLIGLFISGFCLLSTTVNAQELDFCGTHMTEEDIAWLRSFKQNPPANFKQVDELIYIPLQFHIVGDDLGNGYFKQASVLQMMCDLNADMDATGHSFRFYLYENEFIYHDESFIFNHEDTNFQTANFFNQNNNDEAVNIYMVADPIGACGYFSPGVDMISVAKSCANPAATTLTHELGHYFSLPHTFFGWEFFDNEDPPIEFWENVARTGPDKNCHETADLFCDTEPDYLDFRWGCPWDTLTDATGVPFTVDSSIYMCYSTDGCQSRFSNEQMEAMEANLQFQRSYLLDHQQSLNFAPISETTVHYPAGGDVPAGDVFFQWAAVEGVNSYQFRISGFTSGFELDTMLAENEIIIPNLPAGELHVWGVKPYNDGNYCLAAVSGNFVPSSSAVFTPTILAVIQPSCNGVDNGSITIEVAGGDGNYAYLWEDGTIGPTINNLAEGTYDVQVTDGTGNTETIKIKVGEPGLVDGEVTQGLNGELNLTVDGGVGPYTTVWPNGDTTLSTSGIEAGEHTVTLIDGGGCDATITFTVLGLETSISNISCSGEVDGKIEFLSGVGGTAPYYYIYEGSLLDTTEMNNLASGSYEIEVRDNLGNIAFFDYEIVEPAPINVEVFPDDFMMIAEGTGGTPPYEFEWGFGNTLEYGDTIDVSNVDNGVYNLTMTDASGCTTNRNFVVQLSGIEDLNSLTGYSVNVFPNPVIGNHFFLDMNFTRSEKAVLRVFNETGKEVLVESKTIAADSDFWKVNTAEWSAGIYLIQLQAESGQLMQKLVVE